jgi:mucin-like protein
MHLRAPACQVAQKKAECSQLCTQAALNDSAQFNNDAWWCSRLPADFDGQVTAYSAIGTLSYDSAQGRHVHCVTKCDCPPGWIWDANGPAGKRCKRAIEGCVLPGVPNNTQIDGWGFTWGEQVWQWGPCATQKWTEWFDRDDSTGNGDYEMLTDALQAGKACANPLDIECKTLGGQDYTTTGLIYHCDKTKGGWCVNAEQTAGKSCLDFKVRYLCP